MGSEQQMRMRRSEELRRIGERSGIAVATLERGRHDEGRMFWELASAVGAVTVLLASISLAIASF